MAITVLASTTVIAERLRVIARRRLDPHRFHAEGRIARLDAGQLAEHLARVDGELALGIDHALAHRHAGEIDAIGVRRQIQVVADVHGLHEEAEILRELAAHAANARQQIAALRFVDQRHQAIADFEADDVDRLHVFPRQLARFGAGGGGAAGGGSSSFFDRLQAGLRDFLCSIHAPPPQSAAISRNGTFGMPGIRPITPSRLAAIASARG